MIDAPGQSRCPDKIGRTAYQYSVGAGFYPPFIIYDLNYYRGRRTGFELRQFFPLAEKETGPLIYKLDFMHILHQFKAEMLSGKIMRWNTKWSNHSITKMN
jgi:hypothetical protein